MSVSHVAFGLLAVLALVFGVNLYSATSRFVSAYNAYDAVWLELDDVRYSDPETPVMALVTIHNPSDRTVEIQAIELRLDAGIRRVGGGETRPVQPVSVAERERFTLTPGASRQFEVLLNIDDRDYVVRHGGATIEWNVSGRFQVVLDSGLDPEWIPT